MRTLLATLALVAAAHSAQAQARPQLAPETRVRVIVPDRGVLEKTAATVIAAAEDSVILQISGRQRAFAYTDIQRLEVSRGTRPARSVVWGAVIGVGAALLAAEVEHRAYLGPPDEQEPYPAGRRAKLMLSGASLGAIFGALIPSDRWVHTPL